MATFTKQKKKQQKLLIVLGAVVGLIVLVLLWGRLGGGGTGEVGTIEVTESVLPATQKIINEVAIPHSFFEDNILGGFVPYEPISAPAVKGRLNPFILFSPEPEPADIIEEAIVEEEL